MTRATAKKTPATKSGAATAAPRDAAASKPATDPQSVTPEMKEIIKRTLDEHRETLRELAKR